MPECVTFPVAESPMHSRERAWLGTEGVGCAPSKAGDSLCAQFHESRAVEAQISPWLGPTWEAEQETAERRLEEQAGDT